MQQNSSIKTDLIPGYFIQVNVLKKILIRATFSAFGIGIQRFHKMAADVID